MTFAQALKTVFFFKYATLKGRAARSEYWWITFFNIIVTTILFAIMTLPYFSQAILPGLDSFGYAISGLCLDYQLLITVPTISVIIRRLHDLNRSGWWHIIALIPIIGIFVMLYWFCHKGTEGANKYGADPLA